MIAPRTVFADEGYRRILVPLDGGAEAEVALRPAAELAVRYDADLHLATMTKPSQGDGDAGIAARYLADVADRVSGTWGCEVRSRLIAFGLRGTRLSDLTDYLKADLVVAATMSTDGGDRDLLGTSAITLTRRLVTPVMLVPCGGAPEMRGVVAAVDPACDPGQDVLRHATSCARAWGVPLQTHVMSGLDAVAALADFVESAVADLLVVGGHDRGPLERLLGLGGRDAVAGRMRTSSGLLVCPVA